MKLLLRLKLLLRPFALLAVAAPATAYAEWTPLIRTADFTGIQSDVITVASGIVGILLVIVGLGILVKVLGR